MFEDIKRVNGRRTVNAMAKKKIDEMVNNGRQNTTQTIKD
jgi:hypothetical protein